MRQHTIELLVMRHGQTAGNLEHRYNGTTDEPLCEQGIEACQQRGADTSVGNVFVSPLLRARQTAQICFPNARQHVVQGLSETDFGIFEGKSFDQLKDDPCYRAWVESGCEDPCSQGETHTQFANRVAGAFKQLVSNAVGAGDDRLVIVAHGGTVMAIMERFAQERRGFYDWHVPNCGGFCAQVVCGSGGEPVIVNHAPL